MKNVIALLSMFSWVGILFAQPAQTPTPRPLVIAHVTLIDMTGGPPRQDMTVVVAGDRIQSIGRSSRVRVPANALIVDGAGKFLLPGFWDMHAHVLHKPRFATFLPLLIANGVTGVRDMATHTPLDEVRRWREEIAAGTRIGPRIVAAGLILDGPKPLNPSVSIAIKDAGDGRRAVRQMKEQGADFIKVYSSLPRDAFYAIADEASKQGLPFAGHLPTSVTACEASAAGQKSFEHMLGWFESCEEKAERIGRRDERPTTAPDATPEPRGLVAGSLKQITDSASFDEPEARALATVLARNGTWLTPTLSARWAATYYDEKVSKGDPRSKYILPAMRESWETSGPFAQFTAEQLATLKLGYDSLLKALARMHRAGAKLLAGTDTGVPYTFPGFSVHDELELMVRAGLTPFEALQTATIHPAKFLGRENDLGTIERGKLADLLLIDGNPLTDVSTTRRITAVIANGRLYDRTHLNELLAEVEAAARQP